MLSGRRRGNSRENVSWTDHSMTDNPHTHVHHSLAGPHEAVDSVLRIIDLHDVRRQGRIALESGDDVVHGPDGALDVGDDEGFVVLHDEI